MYRKQKEQIVKLLDDNPEFAKELAKENVFFKTTDEEVREVVENLKPIKGLGIKINNEHFEEILNTKINRKLCYTCGNYQPHKLRWCSQCGSEFKGENLTIKNQLQIGKDRQLTSKNVTLSPKYLAAIWKRKLQENNLTEEMFIKYMEDKYGFNEKDFRN